MHVYCVIFTCMYGAISSWRVLKQIIHGKSYFTNKILIHHKKSNSSSKVVSLKENNYAISLN